MGHDGWKPTIQPQPDKPLGELVQREEEWHGRKEQLSPMFDLGERDHSDGAQYGAANKVRAS